MSNNTVTNSSLQIPKTTKPLPTNKTLCNSVETLGLSNTQRRIFSYAEQAVAKCFDRAIDKSLQVFCFRLIIEDYPDSLLYNMTTLDVIVRIIQKPL